MFKHLILLLFLCGIGSGGGGGGSGSRSFPEGPTADSQGMAAGNGLNKTLGANGLGGSPGEVLRNFRNPVLEYLLSKGSDGTRGAPPRGVVREIRHGQSLLVPGFPGGLRPPAGQLDERPHPGKDVSPVDAFWNFLKDKTGGGPGESVVTSPVLHVNESPEGKPETTRVRAYPAVAVVINTFGRDGVLKSSVTHFQPDFRTNSLEEGATDGGAPGAPRLRPRQGVPWPFAGFFPVVINDPFLSVYNGVASGMYATFSSMVEYGPGADICRKDGPRGREEQPPADPDVFDEVTLDTEPPGRRGRARPRRDATSIVLRTRQGDRIDVTLEEPPDANGIGEPDERARSFSQVLVNTPPLSTILRPPHQGYADKKRKTKPSKPMKEDNSEEVGEEHEEETTGQTQESANEAVAISPPPEGASVAEAKPIGLAIAGPGGVAASKPQGTAVAGPGGLAIARPVGTAIAGVDVEGSVPIGGQQKNNKKKPKQEQEQTEGELHYVGGLTGPIGNPQPKEFADGTPYKTKDAEGPGLRDNLFFRGRHDATGYQIKLGQQNGKYGFVPVFSSPVQGAERLQKRMDAPTFFHGLLGNGGQRNEDLAATYQMQF